MNSRSVCTAFLCLKLLGVRKRNLELYFRPRRKIQRDRASVATIFIVHGKRAFSSLQLGFSTIRFLSQRHHQSFLTIQILFIAFNMFRTRVSTTIWRYIMRPSQVAPKPERSCVRSMIGLSVKKIYTLMVTDRIGLLHTSYSLPLTACPSSRAFGTLSISKISSQIWFRV